VALFSHTLLASGLLLPSHPGCFSSLSQRPVASTRSMLDTLVMDNQEHSSPRVYPGERREYYAQRYCTPSYTTRVGIPGTHPSSSWCIPGTHPSSSWWCIRLLPSLLVVYTPPPCRWGTSSRVNRLSRNDGKVTEMTEMTVIDINGKELPGRLIPDKRWRTGQKRQIGTERPESEESAVYACFRHFYAFFELLFCPFYTQNGD